MNRNELTTSIQCPEHRALHLNDRLPSPQAKEENLGGTKVGAGVVFVPLNHSSPDYARHQHFLSIEKLTSTDIEFIKLFLQTRD